MESFANCLLLELSVDSAVDGDMPELINTQLQQSAMSRRSHRQNGGWRYACVNLTDVTLTLIHKRVEI